MADTEARKFMDNIWASGAAAQRTDPEDLGIDRDEGWTVAYEQLDSGFEPEREVWNQKGREWDGGMAFSMTSGGVQQYDAEVNYAQYARAAVEEHKYVALVATGPAFGNAVQPGTEGAAGIWRLY